jgi:hypothetical protein
MRKYLTLITALGALVALTVVGLAVAAPKPNQPSKTVVGNLELEFNGNFSPKTLSKTKLTPIGLSAEGKIKTLDGSHPPALQKFLIETDKNGAVDVQGYPTCKSSQLQAQDTAHAEKICKSAIIGTGHTNVEILFEESRKVPVSSKLIVFNGGVKGGVTTLYIHAYITLPVPAAIVTTLKIKKIHHGRYGLLTEATIPKIAGGAGSVTSFNVEINKKFNYKGKKKSILSAKCPDGKLQAHGTAYFSDGTKASAEFLRTCTGKK